MSHYNAKITWKNEAGEDFLHNRYSRGHEWEFDAGLKVPGSSSVNSVRLPFSVEAAVDPEEALVASASSCHMLFFLSFAAKKGFLVESYTDEAVGEMTDDENGKKWISIITLKPTIIWGGEKLPTSQEIAELHHDSHEHCYIANSIKAEVVIAE